ncbi:spore germination protein GerPE [Jeotgalibacillus marinus]|uniref:Spore germination protein GerPE n=1 Tax=Jeotgalibacillus marinus TaxID=86667 RepID=A0ABV3Q402_9BACL
MYSKIGNVSIIDFSSSSVLQVGDSNNIDSLANVFAVQRQQEQFYNFEAPYSMYPIFSRPPKPFRCSCPPTLNYPSKNTVGIFRNIGFDAASVLHVGNTCHVRMVSRVINVRQLEKPLQDKEAEPAVPGILVPLQPLG